jgi:two-component system, NarL family, sensor histidine kinase BarA
MFMAKPGKLFLRRLLRSPIFRFMAQPRESSFRRILLSRILLLSVPVLLAGEYITYRKARSSLLETARQNLTESAVRKGERIGETIEALQMNLITAAQATALQSSSLELSQKFIGQLKQQLPTKVECIQLTDLKLGKLVSSTCGESAIYTVNQNLWPSEQSVSSLNRASVRVSALIKSQSLLKTEQIRGNGQLQLILTAPVYNRSGQLKYALTMQSSLYQQQADIQGSLYGSTVVIDQDGTILEHPIPNQVGRNIRQHTDAKRLESIIKNAIGGQQNFLHVFSFGQKGVESVVGYFSCC